MTSDVRNLITRYTQNLEYLSTIELLLLGILEELERTRASSDTSSERQRTPSKIDPQELRLPLGEAIIGVADIPETSKPRRGRPKKDV